jgi:UDP-N-acetylmuramate--alanine ligase
MQCIRQLENYILEKSTGCFSAHLFSRTSDFADDFAKSLSNFDEILLMDIYPAESFLWKELPQNGCCQN